MTSPNVTAIAAALGAVFGLLVIAVIERLSRIMR